MKKIIILLFLLNPVFSHSQLFWNTVIDFNAYNKSRVTNQALFQDSIILVSGFVSLTSCPYHELFAFNLNGEILWKTKGFHDVIYSGADYIYTAGYKGMDDIAGFTQVVVNKYDNQGNEIFSIGYPDIPHEEHLSYRVSSIEVNSNKDVIVGLTDRISSKNFIMVVDSSGNNVDVYDVDINNDIESVSEINTSRYLLTTKEMLYLTDSKFTFFDSIALSDVVSVSIKDDIIYALLKSSLIRLDTNLNLNDTILSNTTEDFEQMKFYDNSLWVKSITQENVNLIQIIDDVVIDTLSFNLLSDVKGFIVSDTSYIFIGNSFSNQICIYSVGNSVQHIPNSILPDIEIVDFNISEINIWYYETYERGYSFSTDITIKNNGYEAISSYSIFSKLNGGQNCFQVFFYQKFEEVEILPGQSYTFKIGRLTQEGVNNNQLCFECLSPNSNIEVETHNNTLCKTFTITGIDQRNEMNFSVYPNPVSDYFHIDTDGNVSKKIELYDITGQIVYSSENQSPSVMIDLKDYASGLYLLRIESNQKIYTTKVVKK